MGGVVCSCPPATCPRWSTHSRICSATRGCARPWRGAPGSGPSSSSTCGVTARVWPSISRAPDGSRRRNACWRWRTHEPPRDGHHILGARRRRKVDPDRLARRRARASPSSRHGPAHGRWRGGVRLLARGAELVATIGRPGEWTEAGEQRPGCRSPAVGRTAPRPGARGARRPPAGRHPLEQAAAATLVPARSPDLRRDPLLRRQGAGPRAPDRSLLLRHARRRGRRGPLVLGRAPRAAHARARRPRVPRREPRRVIRAQRGIHGGLPGASERRVPAHRSARPVGGGASERELVRDPPRPRARDQRAHARMTSPRAPLPSTERAHARLALRLLLDRRGDRPADVAVDWALLLALAQQNSVLIRVAERLPLAGLEPPDFFVAAAERERERTEAVFAVMRRLGERCEEAGLDYLFPTAWQHYPDVGRDLDLLLLSRSQDVDGAILAGTAASLRARDLRDRLAGTALYWLNEVALPLDIHHGRLGLVGEHGTYPAGLIHRRRRHLVAGEERFTPAPEDQLILQGMSRVAGRRSFSIADAAATAAIVRGQRLDWKYLVSVARHIGVLPGLSCYLS